MCYPDRSSSGKCIRSSFTVCKTRDFSVRVILGEGFVPGHACPAGRACLPAVRERW